MRAAPPPQALARPSFSLLPEVSEPEADGALRAVYADIKRVLGVSLVNAVYRALGVYPAFLTDAWSAVRPNLLTEAFDRAANQLRLAAVNLVVREAPVGSDLPLLRRLEYLPEDISHLVRGMAAFHYVNPKLLVWVTALRLAAGQAQAPGPSNFEPAPEPPAPREAPPLGDPVPLHLVPPEEAPPQVAFRYQGLRERLGVPVVNSDFQFLGGYPTYLYSLYPHLEGLVNAAGFSEAAAALGDRATALAAQLPYRVALSGHDPGAQALLDLFYGLLPKLILVVALTNRRLGNRQDLYAR